MASQYEGIPGLAEQEQALLRRQKIAEAMMAQGMQPLTAPTVQRTGAPAQISWSQGLAQMANAYLGAKANKKSEKDLAGLADKRQQMVADALAKYEAQSKGLPANITLGDPAGGPPETLNQTYKADPEGAARAALMNPAASSGLQAIASHDLEQAAKANEPYSLGPGQRRFVKGVEQAQVPPTPEQKGVEEVSIGGGYWMKFEVKPDGTVDMSKPIGRSYNSKPNASSTTINMAQENAFEKALGEALGKDAVTSWNGAKDSVQILQTITEASKLLDAGMITGFGAEFLVSAGQALRRLGFNVAEGDLENTQAYASWLGNNVGKIIKQFGAGTGLSDADREYAEKIVGGKITLDEKALRKILELNERGSRNVIALHNKTYGGVKSTIPLTVEAPVGEWTTLQ